MASRFDIPADTLEKVPLGTDDRGLSLLEAIPLAFGAPSGVRIATVKMPRESYPGTDLEDALFTIGVNQHLTEGECTRFPTLGYPQTVYSKIMSGVTFRGVKFEGAATGHQDLGESYHAYFRGECIAVGYVLATGGYGAVEGLQRAPIESIKTQLAAILDSVRIGRPRNAR